MRPEVSEEGRNSCKMQIVSFQIQAKQNSQITQIRHYNKIFQKGHRKVERVVKCKQCHFRFSPITAKNRNDQSPQRQVEIILKCKQCHFRFRQKIFSTHNPYEQKTRIISSHLEVEAGKPINHGHLGRRQHLTF